MKNIGYYFSKEYQKEKADKFLSEIKEIATNYANEYNSYESISLEIPKIDKKTKELTKNVKTFIIFYIIAFTSLFIYISLKMLEIKINTFLFLSTSLILGIIFIILIIFDISKENKNIIVSIFFNKDDLTFEFKDNNKKTFNIKDINITTKLIHHKDDNFRDDFIITINNKKSLKKDKYFININNIEKEFFAFIIFIKSLNSNIDFYNISNEQLNILYTNTYNNNLGLSPKKNLSYLLIIGLFLTFISVFLLINVISNCIDIIKYEKTTATITNHNKVNTHNQKGEHINYTYLDIEYEFNEETYYDRIISDYTLFDMISNKRTIYVNPNNPSSYTNFRYENLILLIFLSCISYFLIYKYRENAIIHKRTENIYGNNTI